MDVPSSFFGSFRLERSENFDEYLYSKGVNWFVRKMIQMSSITKVIGPGNAAHHFSFTNVSPKKHLQYLDCQLNQPFEAEGLDGKMHRVTFGLENGTLTETHVRLDDANDKGEKYTYVRDGDYLILKMQNESVGCSRFFKKIDT